MSEKPIMAKAFGGEYPVCSEQDKVAIEEGYKKAFAWLESPEGRAEDEATRQECSCAVIGRLLAGTATYTDMVIVGIDMARSVYRRKMMGEMVLGLMDSLQGAGVQADPIITSDKPKKEWIN